MEHRAPGRGEGRIEIEEAPSLGKEKDRTDLYAQENARRMGQRSLQAGHARVSGADVTRTVRLERTPPVRPQFPQRSRHICSPIVQEIRGGLAWAGTIARSGVRPAISSTSLVRIASLNWSRL